MRSPCLVAVVLCLPVLAKAQTNETVVPAGTLLQCTLDEPRFSSEAAQVGDPVLCHVHSLGMFGRPVLPRGAYLSGRLEDFRDPGHFFGKGWLKLEFESLTLPGGTFPIAAKVVFVPHYRVDAEGKIRGHGHARRDAIEWSLPVFWPEKLITLPARGPRPVLKGETLILLRILEDVSIPNDATSTSSAALSKPLASTARSRFSTNGGASSAMADRVFPRLRYGGATAPGAEVELPLMSFSAENWRIAVNETSRSTERPRRDLKPTFLILKDGRAYVVTNYWFDGGELTYFASDGVRHDLPAQDLDLETTTRVNRERGVPFVIRSNPAEAEP